METDQRATRAYRVGAAVIASLFLAAVAWQFLIKPQIFRVVTCDAWTVELRDGTVLYAPGYTPELAAGGGFGPCWELPAGITMDDLKY
jgi:hypothetical protein